MIDLRSDTVSQPSDGMRKSMATAEVGDDVFRDDPTVLELEEKVAGLLAKEDAVYVPSGTMSNQIALRAHTAAGDIVLAAGGAHIDSHEVGAANALAGVTVRQLPTDRGTFTADSVRVYMPNPPASIPSQIMQPVGLVTCENTHEGAGGAVWPLDTISDVAATSRSFDVATHMDGARLWNAVAASGTSAADYAAGFDTVSVCFSKGLGAPVGSALVGPADVIADARRFKHMYGGGFRQAGIIAAGALYALQHHRERLVEDHANAARLAAELAAVAGIDIDPVSVETNIVYFHVTTVPAEQFCASLHDSGVAMLAAGGTLVRAVTHLGISSSDIDEALAAVAGVLGG